MNCVLCGAAIASAESFVGMGGGGGKMFAHAECYERGEVGVRAHCEAAVRRAEKVEVIRVVSVKGHGTRQDLVREVTEYFTLGGELIATFDPCAPAEGPLKAANPPA